MSDHTKKKNETSRKKKSQLPSCGEKGPQGIPILYGLRHGQHTSDHTNSENKKTGSTFACRPQNVDVLLTGNVHNHSMVDIVDKYSEFDLIDGIWLASLYDGFNEGPQIIPKLKGLGNERLNTSDHSNKKKRLTFGDLRQTFVIENDIDDLENGPKPSWVDKIPVPDWVDDVWLSSPKNNVKEAMEGLALGSGVIPRPDVIASPDVITSSDVFASPDVIASPNVIASSDVFDSPDVIASPDVIVSPNAIANPDMIARSEVDHVDVGLPTLEPKLIPASSEPTAVSMDSGTGPTRDNEASTRDDHPAVNNIPEQERARENDPLNVADILRDGYCIIADGPNYVKRRCG